MKKYGLAVMRTLGLPRNELKRLTLKVRDVSVNLDVSGMYNPNFNGTLSKDQFELKTDGDVYNLYGGFSDGAGSYTAHWMIIRGKALRQVISKDERDFYWQQK